MSLFVIDVEADGQIPHVYSMVCFGAVKVDRKLDQTFYGTTAPISEIYDEKALAVSKFTREQHLTFDNPREVMYDFANWIETVNKAGRPMFISDNLAFDWQWINYYFHFYMGKNPFGWSGRRIGDIYCGLQKDAYAKWKYLRQTKFTDLKGNIHNGYDHTHDPVQDALGNAHVIVYMADKLGLNLKLD